MPTYNYECPNCRHIFEVRHSLGAESPCCPSCGTLPNRVILSAPAIHGEMSRGREAAARTFEPQNSRKHGPGCPCCHHHPDS